MIGLGVFGTLLLLASTVWLVVWLLKLLFPKGD